MINDCNCEHIIETDDPIVVSTVTCPDLPYCKTTVYSNCVIYSGADIGCAATIGGISTFDATGSAGDTGSYTITGLSATGGTGTGAIFSVSGNLSDTTYSVGITAAGSGYQVGDILTIPGTSIQATFTSPANDVTIEVTALSAPVDGVSVQIYNGDTLNEVISNLNDRICNITPDEGADYSAYTYGCLRVGGNLNSVGTVITTVEQFVEATAAALCAIDTRLEAVEVPDVDPACLGLVGGETLVEVIDAISTKLCEIEATFALPITVNNDCFTSEPAGTDPISDWFQWIIDNTCAINTALTASISTQTTRINNINTYLHGTTAPGYPITYDISCMGGSATATLHASIGEFITEICAINTTLAALPDFDAISLSWATCFSGAPYTYSNATQTLQTQLERFLNIVSREKIEFSADFDVTDSACGKTVELAAGVGDFSCDDLAGCEIQNLGNVDDTAATVSGDVYKWNDTSGMFELVALDSFTNIGVVDKAGAYSAEPLGFYFKAAAVTAPAQKAFNIGFVEDSWTAVSSLTADYVTTVSDPLTVKKTWDGHILFKGVVNSISAPSNSAFDLVAGKQLFTMPTGFYPTNFVNMDINIHYVPDSGADTPMTLAGYITISNTTGVVTFYCADADPAGTAIAITALSANEVHGFSFTGKAIYQ